MTKGMTARQAELSDAALAIIARDGMPALSFRAVAAESGWSLGAVQRAFSSKAHMLSLAFERLRAQAAPLPDGEPGRPSLHVWLVDLLLRLLPLDAARVAAQRQGEAFAEHALTDPHIAAAVSASDDEVRRLLASLVARARAEGEIPLTVDPETVAWAVLALAQGAATQLLYQPADEAVARARLDGAVGALLSG